MSNLYSKQPPKRVKDLSNEELKQMLEDYKNVMESLYEY